MSVIVNNVELETLIDDFYTFLNGAIDADVTLSDSFIMESYRKFCINELDRTGNSWSNLKTYLKDDIIVYNEEIYICILSNINKQPDTEVLYWKIVSSTSVNSGYGLSGYLSFDMFSGDIIESKNILSVTKISEVEVEITVADSIRKGDGNKLIWAFSYESLDIDLAEINAYLSNYYYFIFGRTEYNNDNKIRFILNSDTVNFNPIINIMFV